MFCFLFIEKVINVFFFHSHRTKRLVLFLFIMVPNVFCFVLICDGPKRFVVFYLNDPECFILLLCSWS